MKPEYARLLCAADAVNALLQSGELFDTESETSVDRIAGVLDELEAAAEQCHSVQTVSPFARHANRILYDNPSEALRGFVLSLADGQTPCQLGALLREAEGDDSLKRLVVDCFLRAAMGPDAALSALATALKATERLCA
jgi:hypothetical protein